MHLSSVITAALDLLFPPSKKEQQIRELYKKDNLSLPQADNPTQSFVHAGVNYRHEKVRNIVQAAKYGSSQTAVKLISTVLYDQLLSVCEQERVFADTLTLVPIPMSHKRKHKRNGNHCRAIVKATTKHDTSGTLRFKSALKKVKETPPQTTLTKKERQSNLSGAFQLKPSINVTNQVVVLIDDVTTTGATFNEAHRALKAGNPERILALAFAH